MFLLFDLDGVLVEFKQIHKQAFLEAWNELNPSFPISEEFHAKHLEARSTKQKLAICATFHKSDTNAVYEKKQAITELYLRNANVYTNTKRALQWAVDHGHTLVCCSNSIRSTVETSLSKLIPLESFAFYLSNEDVTAPKPDPEMYVKAVEKLNANPKDVLIFEDSEVGKQAAYAAGFTVIPIVDALDLTPRFLEQSIQHRARPMCPRINVVIPMAGLGSRFQKCGYTTPKPFLPVFGKPMFQWVIENIVPKSIQPFAKIHLIVREEHRARFDEYNTEDSYHIHTVPTLTEGAACTVLSIRESIDNEDPLVIANSDQYLDWDAEGFYNCLFHPDWDGVLSTFPQHDPTDLRWSYVQMSKEGEVERVEEKMFLGPLATTGVYGWKRGKDFVQDTLQMIQANIRVNNEFYVCPVYNMGIERSLKFRTLDCEKMWGLGVPTDYEHFLTNWNTKC